MLTETYVLPSLHPFLSDLITFNLCKVVPVNFSDSWYTLSGLKEGALGWYFQSKSSEEALWDIIGSRGKKYPMSCLIERVFGCL